MTPTGSCLNSCSPLDVWEGTRFVGEEISLGVGNRLGGVKILAILNAFSVPVCMKVLAIPVAMPSWTLS